MSKQNLRDKKFETYKVQLNIKYNTLQQKLEKYSSL